MRRFCLVAVLLLLQAGLAGCGTQAFTTKLDERTFKIEGPPVPGGADAPNRRMAERLCPKGYRVMEQSTARLDPAEGLTTYWTIRCL